MFSPDFSAFTLTHFLGLGPARVSFQICCPSGIARAVDALRAWFTFEVSRSVHPGAWNHGVPWCYTWGTPKMHRSHTKPGFLGADEASHGLIGNLKTGWQHSIETLLGIRWYLSSRMKDYQLPSQQLGCSDAVHCCCAASIALNNCLGALEWWVTVSHPIFGILYPVGWSYSYTVTVKLGPGSSGPQSHPSNLLDPQGIRRIRLQASHTATYKRRHQCNTNISTAQTSVEAGNMPGWWF